MFTFNRRFLSPHFSSIFLKMSSPGASNTSPFFSQRTTRSKDSGAKLSLKEKLEKTEGKPRAKKGAKLAIQADPQPIQATTSLTSTIKKRDINIPATATDPKQKKWEPKDWREVLEKLRQMRQSRPAPVDTMGCHMCSDDKATPEEKRFHILVALMLSSQTKDEVDFEGQCYSTSGHSN